MEFLGIDRRTHGILCLIVLAVILSLGLWPFHSPANEVHWLSGTNGIAFGEDGTIFSAEPLRLPHAPGAQGRTVEVWIRPEYSDCTCTVLAFYGPGNLVPFALRQDYEDLDVGWLESGSARVKDVFEEHKLVMVTVTSGADGTAVYVNGEQKWKDAHQHAFDNPFEGGLVLGDAPGQPDNWVGELRGLAIYDLALSDVAVKRSFSSWKETHRWPEDADPAMGYLFDEKTGSRIRSAVQPNVDLQIPEKYSVVGKRFLEPFWEEFELTRNFAESAVKNIVGFIPYGFCFYPYLLSWKLRRATLWTTLLGTAASITIEVFQVLLPMRESGTTDLFTNTLGTWLGVAGYQRYGPALLQRVATLFPWLRFA
jgi:hypothetical protein